MALEPELAVGAQGSCGSKAGRRRAWELPHGQARPALAPSVPRPETQCRGLGGGSGGPHVPLSCAPGVCLPGAGHGKDVRLQAPGEEEDQEAEGGVHGPQREAHPGEGQQPVRGECPGPSGRPRSSVRGSRPWGSGGPPREVERSGRRKLQTGSQVLPYRKAPWGQLRLTMSCC